MTDQQHLITPPHDQVYLWWEEACKRPPSSFYEKLDYVAAKATSWGWQQRDASVADELQRARDQELEACCSLLDINGCPDKWIYILRAARRPKPKSLAEEALEEVGVFEGMGTCNIDIIRRALERLQELEEQGDG